MTAIISSPWGARASIEAERCGIEVRAGVGMSILGAIDLASKGNLIDGRELALDPVSINFSEAWPSTSSVAADEAQLTRNPFEGLAGELGIGGFFTGLEEEERFVGLRMEVVLGF